MVVDGGVVVSARAISGGRWHGGKREMRMVVGAVVPPSPVGSCRCCRSQKRHVLAAPPCRSAYLRNKLTVLRDTTPCATPGDPSLLQCYWREEAMGWRAVHARHHGKSPAAHNLQIGISGGAGRIWPGGGGRRLRVAQSGMGTTPLDWGSIADGTRSTGDVAAPRVGSIRIGAPSGARSFASDLGWRRLRERKGFYMGGYMRGCSIRACRKDDERMSLYRRGGCTLSHGNRTETVMINKKKPDRRGGIMYESVGCVCRPGGGTEFRHGSDRCQGASWNLW